MAINEKAIIEGISQLDVAGNEHGLIPAFGVYLTSGSASFYNNLNFEFERKVHKSYQPIVEQILTQAAHVCGYNTFRGIQTSMEWEGLIAPMIESEADRVHASVIVCNALGWTNWKITDMVPGKSCTIVAEGGYEAELYQEKYGKSAHPICYMIRGVASALNDLSYGDEYPTGIFTFDTVEKKCRAMGDKYCEFVTTRREL